MEKIEILKEYLIKLNDLYDEYFGDFINGEEPKRLSDNRIPHEVYELKNQISEYLSSSDFDDIDLKYDEFDKAYFDLFEKVKPLINHFKKKN